MASPHAAAPLLLAQAQVGAVRLGIPADSVVQAIRLSGPAALLPRRAGALRGVAEHDGMLVPVVDLARWVDVGTPPSGHQNGTARILVLRERGRVVGLQVDVLDGLVEVPPQAVHRLHHDEDPEEVFQSAVRVPQGGILSLLEVGRLADLAASWHAAGGPEQAEAPAHQGNASAADNTPDASAQDYALLELDGVRLAVAASTLVEVVAMPALEVLAGGVGGWCIWRGRHLAVLAQDALPALPPAHAAPLLAVIEHGGLALGLPTRAVLGLQPLSTAGRLESDGHGAPVAAMHDGEGELLLLDSAALFARSPEALLSIPPAGAAASAARRDGRVNEGACIVFEAGALFAVAIDTVEQILPLAPAAAPGAAGATMAWRDATIALVDLRPADACAVAPTAGHVLVALEGAAPVAYIVTRVDVLVPSGSARLYRMGAGDDAVEFITTEGAQGQASYRIVALGQLPAPPR